MPPFRAGSWFHSLQATSQALHPMHTVVSVKKPIGSAITPSPLERGLRPRHPALGGDSEERASSARRASEGGRSPPGSCLLHVAHEGLPLVNRDVGISYQGRELVAGITGAEP